MKTAHRSLCLLLLITGCGALVPPQSAPKVTFAAAQGREYKLANNHKLTPVQEEALVMLNELAGRVKNFRHDEVRIMTQALIADLFWGYDENRARRLFKEAFRSVERVMEEENPMRFLSDSPRTSLRSMLLKLITGHDPRLAEELLKSVSERPAKTADANFGKRNQGERPKLSLRVAQELIPSDPSRAAELIRQGFGAGLSMDLVVTLQALRQKDPRLAADVLRRALVEVEVNQDSPLGDLMLLGFYFNQAEDRAAGGNPAKDTQPDLIPPDLIEPYLNFAFKAITLQDQQDRDAAAGPQRKRMVMFDLIDQGMLAALLPLFEERQPERAVAVRARLLKIEGDMPKAVRDASPKPRTVTDWIEEASKTNDSFLRNMLYGEAAMMAGQAGDFDLAISLAGRISERRSAVDDYRRDAVFAAIGRYDIEAGVRYTKDISDPLERARLFGRLARKAFEKSDPQRAAELLKAAEETIVDSKPMPGKADKLLDLATSATADAELGFKLMRTAVEAINEEFPPESDTGGGMSATPPGTQEFKDNLESLARTDFRRALMLARTIRREEISVQALLAACQGALNVRPDPVEGGVRDKK